MTQAVLAKNSDLHGEVGGTELGPYMAALASQIGTLMAACDSFS